MSETAHHPRATEPLPPQATPALARLNKALRPEATR